MNKDTKELKEAIDCLDYIGTQLKELGEEVKNAEEIIDKHVSRTQSKVILRGGRRADLPDYKTRSKKDLYHLNRRSKMSKKARFNTLKEREK